MIRLILPNQNMSSILSSIQTVDHYVFSRKMQVSCSIQSLKLFIFIEGYFLDHAACTDSQEEESVDRLWLVARSLKNESGKYDYKI